MKNLIITLSALSIACLCGQAQNTDSGQAGPGTGPVDGVFPGGPSGPKGTGEALPEDIIAKQDELRALRESLMAERDALIDELGADATQEEIMAALAAWHDANSDELDAIRDEADALRDEIIASRPEGAGPPIPDEVVEKRETMVDLRRSLADSRRAAILALGEDPTDEDVQAAVEAWRTANADVLTEVEDLSKELRDWFRANRPGRAAPSRSQGMADRAASFRENAKALRQNRQAMRNELGNPDLTPEQRRAMIQEFREEQRQILSEQKELRRQERLNQGVGGGDRRPEG